MNGHARVADVTSHDQSQQPFGDRHGLASRIAGEEGRHSIPPAWTEIRGYPGYATNENRHGRKLPTRLALSGVAAVNQRKAGVAVCL
jgi:hypothetical protein